MPNWQYNKHVNFSDELMKKRARRFVERILAETPSKIKEFMKDTRLIHRTYFDGLTPDSAAYFAGNYRGASFKHLREYGVTFGPNSGAPPNLVHAEMAEFAVQLEIILGRLDIVCFANANISGSEKAFRLAEAAAAIFQVFLTIHPYADGNGHISRCILLMLFARFGIACNPNILHPRPNTSPSLGDAIQAHRQGNAKPLISIMLQMMKALQI